MSEPENNDRYHERKPIELKVEYKRLNAFFSDYTHNISNGGTFIRTDKPLPVGTEFTFELIVPRLDAPIAIAGQVRWIVEPGSSENHEVGMGIQFLYSDEDERHAMTRVVEALMEDSLGTLLTSKLMGVRDK